ncbi:MAG: hypothetical protein PW734_11345 [Verrucomicrobium sp.]|nr:hypothetical protein [Verrucomicrobium sp.]
MPPTPKAEVHDTIPYPQHRRVVWEHGMDMSLAFKRLSWITALLAVAAIVESFVLVSIYNRPPVVLDQNDGYVMWRTTEAFKLRPEMIRSYLNSTLKYLYTVSPGNYDLASLRGLVDRRVLRAFANSTDKDLIVTANQHRIYELREIRRYHDPKLPQYITLAVRGERVLYEYDPGAAQPFRMDSPVVTQIVYLQQALPTPENPWGLRLVGLVTLKEDQADDIWRSSVPLRADLKAPKMTPSTQSAGEAIDAQNNSTGGESSSSQ